MLMGQSTGTPEHYTQSVIKCEAKAEEAVQLLVTCGRTLIDRIQW